MTTRVRSTLLRLTLALFTTLFVHSAYAEMQISDLEAGLFTRPHLKLKEGERLLVGGSKETVEATKQFNAELGTKFGIRFNVSGKSLNKPNVVTMLYLTPGIIEKDGSRHDKYTVTKDLDVSASSHDMAFQITENYEQVPGIWEFMVFADDKLLARKSFELLPAVKSK
ncbi:MAG: DUF3859 domain-containing protein [Pseudomonadales bacterium]